jgi:hypothetical protein
MTTAGPPDGGEAGAADKPDVLLVSGDLLSASRIAGLATAVAGSFAQVATPEAAPPDRAWRVVLVDLQTLPGDPAEILARVHAGPAAAGGGPPPRIIAFGPHVAKERLERARQAGAHLVVSRGELLGDFAAVLARGLG